MLIEDAEQPRKQENQIKQSVKLAMADLQVLRNSGFFSCYPEFVGLELKFCKDFAHYLDTDTEYLKCAVRTYFTKNFHNATVSFENKTKGVSVSLIY